MVTIPQLTLYIIGITVLFCQLALFVLAGHNQRRFWYLGAIVLMLIWAGVAFTGESTLQNILVYLLPLLALGIVFANSFPGMSARVPLQQTGEPRITQEDLRGRAGTKEALTYYFGMLTIGLLVALMVCYAFFFQA